MITNVIQDKVVIYHGNCWDGFSGAWIAHKKFGNEAFYYGMNYSMDIPLWLKGKEVYFIDFCFSKEKMDQVVRDNKKVIVIDHHLSTQEVVKSMSEYVFDVDHCGSVLAWKYFFKDEQIPKILEYIEDGDIWVWKQENSKEILAVLDIYDFTFDNWDNLMVRLEDEKQREEMIKQGQNILEYQESTIKRLAKYADEAIIEGERALVINSPILTSELGHMLAQKGIHIGIVWYQVGRTIIVSLRGDGMIDVSLIAKKYGGGGHHNASGFNFQEDQNAPWNLVEKEVDK